MKKIISMVLSFILILGCSTTAFAAETHNYDTENLPHDGADYFETEIKADEENEERISDFVTVYGYQYTKGSLKSGAWRNGTSGGSSTSSAKLSLNYTQDTSYNISFKASVSGGYTNGGTIGSELGVTLGASKSYSLGSGYSVTVPKGSHYLIKYRPMYYTYKVVETRLKGNTISYALPYRSSNGGKVKAVRGSKLGKRFTVAGIREYMKQKEKEDWFDYPRQEQDIEHSSQSMKDYPRWEEDEEEVKESASKAKKQIPTQESQPTRKPDVSVYEAYDEFQEKHEIPENDESFFYGAAFDDFNKEWQGLDAGAGSVSTEFGTTNNSTDAEPYNEDELDELLDNNSSTVPVQNKPFPSPAEYRKLSLEKRAKLLPPPSDDRIEELKKYQDRMGYTEESMRSMRYKMSVYDDFTEEYDYRVKYNRNHSSEEQLKAQAEQQIITPVRRRGRGR